MPLLVTALIVPATDVLRVRPFGSLHTATIAVHTCEPGSPYTITYDGDENTYDDTNDAIAAAYSGNDNTFAAYVVTCNPNYDLALRDLVIYHRTPITIEQL